VAAAPGARARALSIEEIIMAQECSCKTFKLELEFTVAVDEITAGHLDGCEEQRQLPWLKRLQQALLGSETALRRAMFAAIAGKLQAYSDFLAGQDDLASLEAVAGEMDGADLPSMDFPEGDFADLTRPLRGTISARIQHAALYEQAPNPVNMGSAPWRPVWKDLRLGTRIGRLFEQLNIPAAPHPFQKNPEPGHFLMVRYLSEQLDGVHAEGCCTCQAALQGTGEDESQALERLWDSYKEHLRSTGAAIRLLKASKSLLSKN